jgi:alpha-L-rhamnosidase
LSKPPKPGDITGCFVRTAVAQTGSFECASELINKIHRCTLQTQLCNVQMGVPTDDTQRAERLGWGADAWATANEALYNLWMPRVYEKWIGDYRAQQTECGSVGMIVPQAGFEEDTVWSAAFLIVPWLTYLHTGDTRILEENYPNFQRYIEFLEKCGVDKVETMTSNEVINSILWRCGPGNRFPSEENRGYLQLSQWGDHLSTVEDFAFRANHPLSVGTAFYYLQVTLMAKIARVMNRSGDAAECDRLAERIKAAFNKRFYDQKLGYYDTGLQSAQAWALAFGLVDDTEFERVQRRFVNEVVNRQKHLTTGYVGTKFAIEALTQAGRNDVVWKLATATDYPSWGYMLRNNRTTTCEAWDGGGSLNHAPLGAAIDEWFYGGLAGIQPDESAPGYASIIFKPYIPADLAWARASIRTMRGTVRSAWRREGDSVVLEITVPANSSATVEVPTGSADEIMESGTPYAQADGVICLNSSEQETRLRVGSGSYAFTFPSTDLNHTSQVN